MYYISRALNIYFYKYFNIRQNLGLWKNPVLRQIIIAD